MIRFRFLLTWAAISCLTMANPAFGWKVWVEPEGRWTDYLGRLLKFVNAFFWRFLCKLPYGTMLTCGIIFVSLAKLSVWLMGFEPSGVVRNTPASFFVRLHGGHIRKGSWLAKGQALGARGLGNLLFTALFTSGAIFGLCVSCLKA